MENFLEEASHSCDGTVGTADLASAASDSSAAYTAVERMSFAAAIVSVALARSDTIEKPPNSWVLMLVLTKHYRILFLKHLESSFRELISIPL